MINYPVKTMFLDKPSNNMTSIIIKRFKNLKKKRNDNKRRIIRNLKRQFYKQE